MAGPLVADVGKASNMEGSCEYNELAVADNRQGVILKFEGMGEVITPPHRKNLHGTK